MSALHDTFIVFRSELALALRNKVALAIGLIQPFVYLLLFGPLLTQALPAAQNPWLFFVPGLLLQLGLFGTGFAGFNLIPDIRSGFVERLRVAPVSRLAILLGRLLKDSLILGLQAIPLIVVGYLLGMAANPLGVLASLILILITGVGLASLSYVLALGLPNEYLFAPAVNSLAIPLMLLSGILLPVDRGPVWLDWLAHLNPLRYILDATRALFTGALDTTAAIGIAVAVALAIVSVAIGSSLFRRRTA
ncbi:ABC transporter permease [Micromonospora globbae]|jgi:ABC-2 type transport system permease protein|uniref:Transport permease protein n=1 Tax=Micromonospora globbae TaxID=1894969 RepID=A0A420EMW9_9ACTN|nr:ABC transporter permease [Micromonospora globbae]RKF22059.1 ABC transporter permease [Micromonospora globbae]